jgi:hypothetical protein
MPRAPEAAVALRPQLLGQGLRLHRRPLNLALRADNLPPRPQAVARARHPAGHETATWARCLAACLPPRSPTCKRATP